MTGKFGWIPYNCDPEHKKQLEKSKSKPKRTTAEDEKKERARDLARIRQKRHRDKIKAANCHSQMFVQGSSIGSSLEPQDDDSMSLDHSRTHSSEASISPSPIFSTVAPNPFLPNAPTSETPCHPPSNTPPPPPTTYRTMHILYVPDPTRYMGDIVPAQTQIGWNTFHISDSELALVTNMQGLVLHKIKKTKKRNKATNPSPLQYPHEVLMQEWLYIALAICRTRHPDSTPVYSLEVIPWDDFKNSWILADPPSPDMNHLIQHCDIFLGGIDWTIDYSDEKSGYGLPLHQLDRYREQMNLLELETRVWPTPNQVDLMANKVSLIKHLDWIAGKLGSPRPKTVVLTKGGPIPANTVLKRTHSDGELHVQIPGQHERTWNQLDDGPDGALWFSQEYVALLREVGEWRVVMAGGKIIYIVHTASNGGSWNFLDMNKHLSLRELR
ncbi:hypothetical protein BYT27DRAFT_7250351 [Phlegmacium glaucopus]|nr:hypothetical protein BYT27DRAFT_7250351 [Phlegmacium glaucopus]